MAMQCYLNIHTTPGFFLCCFIQDKSIDLHIIQHNIFKYVSKIPQQQKDGQGWQVLYILLSKGEDILWIIYKYI